MHSDENAQDLPTIAAYRELDCTPIPGTVAMVKQVAANELRPGKGNLLKQVGEGASMACAVHIRAGCEGAGNAGLEC